MITEDCRQVVKRAANGSVEAENFLLLLIDLFHVWDDLIDKDKPVYDDAISRAFEAALIWLPRNAFYMRNFADLNVLIANSIRNWQLSTAIERQKITSLFPASFILRDAYTDIVAQVAYITGSRQLAESVGIEVRKHAHEEGFAQYVVGLGLEN